MTKKFEKTAIIIGAGPAGLTAALELLERTSIRPVIIEAGDDVGGISRTYSYKGNRIDLGGHRFFSKSDRVMNWWKKILPLQKGEGATKGELTIAYQGSNRKIESSENGLDPEHDENVMLIRHRVSRIYFLGRLFTYPIGLSADTLFKLGFVRTFRVGFSYLYSICFPIKPEKNLEDFFINRFGRELYRTFFKDYTEKVWGVPCSKIDPDWGSQRVKGLSIKKALLHALARVLKRTGSLEQKSTETSLIEYFLYPKYGPGHLWHEVQKRVIERGGSIIFNSVATDFTWQEDRLHSVSVRNRLNSEIQVFSGEYFFSSMPVRYLIRGLGERVPNQARQVAEQLEYRDFITVGVLLKKMRLSDNADKDGELIKDNWIYIQEPGFKVGRIQIFNNWSPYLVKDPATVWLGMEYFCSKGDQFWSQKDAEIQSFARSELVRMEFAYAEDILDSCVIRSQKTYPAYFGSYRNFQYVREFTDAIENLFLIGRNGMHRYNNQDHSMLAAITAVDNIVSGRKDKANIWEVNAEQDYHEESS